MLREETETSYIAESMQHNISGIDIDAPRGDGNSSAKTFNCSTANWY